MSPEIPILCSIISSRRNQNKPRATGFGPESSGEAPQLHLEGSNGSKNWLENTKRKGEKYPSDIFMH